MPIMLNFKAPELKKTTCSCLFRSIKSHDNVPDLNIHVYSSNSCMLFKLILSSRFCYISIIRKHLHLYVHVNLFLKLILQLNIVSVLFFFFLYRLRNICHRSVTPARLCFNMPTAKS